MKQFYRFDEAGYYIPGGDFLAEEPNGNSTDNPPLDPQGRGMYKPRFVAGKWIDEGQAPEVEPQLPTTEEKVLKLEQENEQLKSSVANLEDMLVILTMP